VSTAGNGGTAHGSSPRVVIATGGTTGHVAPALAVARELRARGAEVSFIGGDRAEATLVPAAGFALHRLDVEGMSRGNPLRALVALARAGRGSWSARRLLSRIRPHAVLGGGGYVAGPVGLAALSTRVPLVLSEGDSHLGLTNRLLARGARRVCLSFPIPGRAGPRYRVTGRPIPYAGGEPTTARERFGVAPQEDCVLVFGGSLGAHSINSTAVAAFADAGFHVLHVSGPRDYPELSAHSLRSGYDLRAQLELEEFAWALSAADLVVARAGSSVLEIAAHGLPSILVPYPHATADHQLANARFMEQAGAALVILDGELSPERLAREVSALLRDRPRLQAMALAARRLARPDAAREIADELLEAAGA
jgi:UDP-N-acetylglucosamine--N-acetylmuramyl-(pentapeptide) pyrophosphoryl-undecaprenol N-acetylglucosamine transferase